MVIQRAFSRYRLADLFDPKKTAFLEDFRMDAASLATNAMVGVRLRAVSSGTGSGIASSSLGVDSVSHALGTVALSPGTTTTGRSSLVGGSASIEVAYGTFTWKARGYFTALSTSGDEYSTVLGYHDDLDSVTINPVDGIFFRYHRAVDGDFWACITAANSDQNPTSPTNFTKTITTVAPAVQGGVVRMQELKIVIRRGGVAYFYIDGALVATHVDNIPAQRAMGMGVRQLKSSGATNHRLVLDYVGEMAEYQER